MLVSSWTFVNLVFLFTTQSCNSSPVIDRHKNFPDQQAIISETSDFGNNTFKVVKGPKYLTVTNYKEVKEIVHKTEEDVEDNPVYYGIVFFVSSILAATCLFGIACVFEYRRCLLGYLKRSRNFLTNVCFNCSWSPHHKSCVDDGYCSYYRSTDNLIDTNKHFIHFVKSLTEPEEDKLVPCPNECALCNQYKSACSTCSSVDLQNESSTTESVEIPTHPTVFYDKETENVNINMPRRTAYLKPSNSQASECECNGMLQSVDNGYLKTDYGLPATISAEQATSSERSNRRTGCVGGIRRVLVKGKKRNGTNPNPRRVTFSTLETVHEF